MAAKETKINTASNSIDLLEKIYGVFVFMLSTDAVIPVIRQQMGVGTDGTTTDSLIRNLWYIVYLIAIILIFYRFKKIIQVVFYNKLIFIMLGFAAVSLLWSVSISLTLRRFVALFFTQVIGIYFYSEYGLDGVLDLLRWTSVVSIILCFIFSIFLPVYGLHHDGVFDGVWRGIYVHKNTLGFNMVIFATLWLLTFLDDVRSKKSKSILSLIFLILALILLIKSESKTSLCVFLIIIGSVPICLLIRKNVILFIGLFFSFITLIGAFLYNGLNTIKELIALMGKDVTLSGRTNIWMLVIQAIKNKPFLGYGYGAFWQGTKGPSEFISSLLEMSVDQAHNGYLNIVLQLGIVGLIIFLLTLIQNIINSLRLQVYSKSYTTIFAFAFMIFMLIFNLSESIIASQNSATWIIYCTLSTYLSYELSHKETLDKGNKLQINSC